MTADLLRIAEDELQKLRGHMRKIADFIQDDAFDDTARRALAQALGLPEPSHTKTTTETAHG